MSENIPKKDMSGLKFRGIDWGTPKEDVISSEDKEPLRNNIRGKTEVLVYNDTLIDYQFSVKIV